MKLIKNGKTKEVYKLDNGNYLLKFKDSVTGGPGGTVDPGGNLVVGEQDGMGQACLAMTTFIFNEVVNRGLAPTHMVETKLAEKSMEVKPAVAFGHGLEIIVRFIATGSFVKRYGLYVQDGQRLSSPLVEITLKDDQRGDPLITEDTLIELGILNQAEINWVKDKARNIAQMIEELGRKNNLEIYDLKMEFGRSADGELILIDEISPGSMRAYQKGRRVEGPELAKIFVG